MKLCCATCGYAADDPSFFRRERGGVFRLKQIVCDACVPYQPTRSERRSIISLLVWQPIWLAAIFAYSRDDPAQALGIVGLLFAGLASLPLATAVHEVGHAVAAVAVGRHVVDLLIGKGPQIAKFRVAGVDIKIGKYLAAGGLMRSFAATDARSRWRDAVLLSSGVLANAMAASLAFLAATRPLQSNDALGAGCSVLLLGFAIVNAGMAAINILPWQISGVGGSDGARLLALTKPDTQLASDGRQLWRTACLTEMGRFERVETEAVAAARGSLVGRFLVIQAMNAISKRRGEQAAMEWYLEAGIDRDMLSTPSEPAAASQSAWLKAGVAWHAFMSGREDLRPMAESLSREAHDVQPDVSAISGTRGVILDRDGDCDEGFEMVLQAARAAVGHEDKADFCDALAAGLRRRGIEARASGFEAVAARSRARMLAQYR